MAEPSEKTIKRLFALSGNICAFPGCQLPVVECAGTITGEICHIKARSKGGPRFDPLQSENERHDFVNLILLCGRHHKVIDDQPDIYTADTLQEMKSVHEEVAGRPEQKTDGFFANLLLNALRQVEITNNSGNIAINSSGAMQAQTITIKTSQQKVSVAPPQGTIGADQDQCRYVDYLIKRYNEFASKDTSRATKFSFGSLSKNIESQFGGPWRLLSAELFDSNLPICSRPHSQDALGETECIEGVSGIFDLPGVRRQTPVAAKAVVFTENMGGASELHLPCCYFRMPNSSASQSRHQPASA